MKNQYIQIFEQLNIIVLRISLFQKQHPNVWILLTDPKIVSIKL